MKEKNYHVLKEALKNLPSYLAPSKVWEDIQRQLSGREKLLGELPLYKAPADAWANIASQLERKRKPATYLWIGLGIAATILFLILIPGEGDKMVATTPISLERELKVAPVLTPAAQATYETQLIYLEKDLASCLLSMSSDETREARPKVAAYYSLATRHDNFLQLQRQATQPEFWNDSLILFEQKRRSMLEEIFTSYCPQFAESKNK
ncbi:MAG: hypothetical protein MRZ79_22880 [Bacteroidia bacterium]|nr:hypothetical protein [Bacteroidia bacterium]